MAEEEDEMAKGQRYERGVRRCSYKALPPPFRIRGFLGNCSRDLRFSEFSATEGGLLTRPSRSPAHIADLSPQFATAHRILADIFANRYGSVIITVQPSVRCFLRDSVFSKLTVVSDPDTT